jgi:pimeloyl-ACP methyl ester carboxylesterase
VPLQTIGDHRLEVERHGSTPGLVLLHEGLGSVSGWRDFPARLSAATGLGALVYSRRGYGRSDPVARSFEPSFMHEEARGDLPALLAAFEVRRPILVGHSDGGSIALIHAAERPSEVAALVLLAPHVFVEDVTVASIAALRERSGERALLDRFRHHHGPNTESLLAAWTGVWLSPAFRGWNIEELLPRIACPVLVVQGEEDEYGTLEQVHVIKSGIPVGVYTCVLPRCGHAPHRDSPEATLDAIAAFLRKF